MAAVAMAAGLLDLILASTASTLDSMAKERERQRYENRRIHDRRIEIQLSLIDPSGMFYVEILVLSQNSSTVKLPCSDSIVTTQAETQTDFYFTGLLPYATPPVSDTRMNAEINDDFSSDSGSSDFSSWNEDRLLETEEEILRDLL